MYKLWIVGWVNCVSVVFAVQVKVEEMETPIEPPETLQKVCVSTVKQEEAGQRIKPGPHQAPEESGLNDVMHKKTTEGKAAEDGGEARGSLEDSFPGESDVEQSESETQNLDLEEGSQDHDGTMDETWESNTEQDTTGEAEELVMWDEFICLKINVEIRKSKDWTPALKMKDVVQS